MKFIPSLSVVFSAGLSVIAVSQAFAAQGPKPLVLQENNAVVLEYDFAEPTLTQQADNELFQIPGLKRYSQVGAPLIPVLAVEILIPYGKKIGKITSISLDSKQLLGTYRLPHGTKPRLKVPYFGLQKPFVATPPDPQIYQMTAFWPVQQHDLVTVQTNRGFDIAHVNLFPLQYSPVTGKVNMTQRLRLRVELVASDAVRHVRSTVQLSQKLERRLANPKSMLTTITKSAWAERSLTKNRADAPPLANGGTLLSDPANPYYGANYKYVVITSAALADESNIPDKKYSFQALCASKIARGMAAGIITTEWIVSNYAGTKPSGGSDKKTKIRDFLVDAYQTWGTQYALLGGDKNIIPVCYFVDTDYQANGDEYRVPTDLYYGCVEPYQPGPDYSFDSDKDGKYGEFTDGPGGDEVDLTAEVFTGRAAVSTPGEVVNFVRKTLVYETIDDPYLNEVGTMGSYLGFGGVQEFTKPFAELIRLGSDDYLGHFTAGFESPGIENARSFNVTTLYDEDWYNDNHDPDFDSANAKPNDGVNWNWNTMGWDAKTDLVPYLNGTNGHTTPHLLYISDHGSPTWGMVKLSTQSTNEHNCDDLRSVKNTKPFFFYDDSCDVGAFDKNDCFGEVITTMEHGAFACILNSRQGLGAEGNTLDSPSTQMTREFFQSVFGEGILELGRAHQEAKESCIWRLGKMGWNRYVYLEVGLFGDPELRLRVSSVMDNCPDDPNKVEPGKCGCGVPEDACATYSLTVNHGSGDGEFEAGAQVTIQAEAAPADQVFDRWVVQTGNPVIAYIDQATTTLTMPAAAVELTATYKPTGDDDPNDDDPNDNDPNDNTDGNPDGSSSLLGGCSLSAADRGGSLLPILGLALLFVRLRRRFSTTR